MILLAGYVTNAVFSEINERDKRRRNIIVHGIAEADDEVVTRVKGYIGNQITPPSF